MYTIKVNDIETNKNYSYQNISIQLTNRKSTQLDI